MSTAARGNGARVLVTAASKHGATAEIAEAIAAGLARRGVDAIARPAEEVVGVDDYDAVVLGSGVYAGHWLKTADELADQHSVALRERRVWLFSSGPLGAPDPKPAEEPVDVAGLLEATGAEAHRVFAGRLDAAHLSFPERAISRALRAPFGDFRDWDAIDAFAGEIARRLGGGP